MKNFLNLYLALVNGNFLIAFAAVFQSLLTYLILGKEWNQYILIVEGTSTLMLYNLMLYLSKPNSPSSSPYMRTRWFFKHMYWMGFITVLALISFINALGRLHLYTITFLGIIGICSLLYGMPVIFIQGHKVGLRQVPGLKLFHIAFIWVMSGIGLPVVELWSSGVTMDWSLVFYQMMCRFIFLLVCTFPFDIRDMKADQHYDMKTIPILLGKRNSIAICYGLLFLHVLLVFFSPYLGSIKLGLLLTDLGVMLTYRFVIFKNNAWYSAVYVMDIMLIIQCLLVLIVSGII